jgi:hypothetical protein
VLSFSEALAEELKLRNISVTALCPGPMTTNFFNVANPRRTKVPKTTMMSRLSPELVARVGYEGMMIGKRVVVPGMLNKLIIVLEIFLPRKLIAKTVMWLNQQL